MLSQKKMSRAEASRLCGIKPQQFGKYVTGENVPSFDKGIEILELANEIQDTIFKMFNISLEIEVNII